MAEPMLLSKPRIVCNVSPSRAKHVKFDFTVNGITANMPLRTSSFLASISRSSFLALLTHCTIWMDRLESSEDCGPSEICLGQKGKLMAVDRILKPFGLDVPAGTIREGYSLPVLSSTTPRSFTQNPALVPLSAIPSASEDPQPPMQPLGGLGSLAVGLLGVLLGLWDFGLGFGLWSRVSGLQIPGPCTPWVVICMRLSDSGFTKLFCVDRSQDPQKQ